MAATCCRVAGRLSSTGKASLNTVRCPFLNVLKHAEEPLPASVLEMVKHCPHMQKHAGVHTHLTEATTAVDIDHEEPCPYASMDKAELVELVEREAKPASTTWNRAAYEKAFSDSVTTVRDEGRYRVFRYLERHAKTYPMVTIALEDGSKKQVVGWCANDYLAQSGHPAVLKAVEEALHATGAGAGGTRNISGSSVHHAALERELADLHGMQGALLFTSCYVANEAVLSTLGRLLPGLQIFSDAGNHASMIQGIRHSGCEKYVYAHNDLASLRRCLAEHGRADAPKLIAFESVNSMEGTIAPIHAICDIAEEFGALTFCDEVHAVGLYGDRGAGVAERDGAAHRLDMVTGTLGKAYGLVGGYLAASGMLTDAIRSSASGFIFTTALPPSVAAGATKSVSLLKSSTQERRFLHANSRRVKLALRDARIPQMPSSSHIVPVMVGDASKCQAASELLLHRHNIYVQPINYPTVPRGTERLRITPSPYHTAEMITHLVAALQDVWAELDLPLLPPDADETTFGAATQPYVPWAGPRLTSEAELVEENDFETLAKDIQNAKQQKKSVHLALHPER